MINKNKIIGAFIGIFLALSFVSAAGCCFNPGTGLCSQNAEQLACISPGVFSSSPSCTTQDCDKACCILGTIAQYTTGRECQILSTAGGFSYPGNWQGMTENDCLLQAQSQVLGACIYGDQYQRDCRYQTYAECSSGNFNAGVFCTNPQLNTTCTTTNETMCFNEDVYGRDSCGNADNMKIDCDYDAGTICTENVTAGKYSAVCKNLNCDNGLSNGGSRCIDIWAALGHDEGTASPVGSRFFKQYCLNGEITTEPCADFREETCEQDGTGEANCKINKWSDCDGANSGEVDAISGFKVDFEKCDEEYCYVWNKLVDETEDSGNYFRYNNGVPTQIGINNPITTDLHLEMCVPDVPGGLQFYDGSGSSGNSRGADAVCELGNYEATIYLTYVTMMSGWVVGHYDNGKWDQNYVNYEDKWGNAGIIDLVSDDWALSTSAYALQAVLENPLASVTGTASTAAAAISGNPKIPDKWFLEVLKNRCVSLGDCAPNVNWLEKSGSSSSSSGFSCRRDGNDLKIKCSFSFECVPFEAPSGGADCKKCGKDELPCSEYRCKALGDCDYYEPGGIDNGFCMASSDNVAPVITSVNLTPQSPIPPYTPVEITIKTDEASKCKFNLNSASGSFDDMEYDFGADYATEHKIRLTLPGQVAGIDRSLPEYSLITNDGNYTLYVRCIDPADNGINSPARPIQFTVMMRPDGIAPSPSNFNPVSGSRIIYNTTQKLINFDIGEPSQCRWDFEETYNMSKMRYSFTCDESLHSDPLDTYECSGILTNVTLALENETTYYIRCKDNPWYASDTITENGVNYSRNEMEYAYAYILRPSEKFEITEVTPSGLIEVPSNNLNLTIIAMTQGGAMYGKSECWWRHANSSEEMGRTAFTKFRSTDASTSAQILTAPYVGENWLGVVCEDDVGNKAEMNVSFNLVMDDSPPLINRIYEQAGKLRVGTDEGSVCYVSFNRVANCLFDFPNSTVMSGLFTTEHDVVWDYDNQYYYIRCRDLFGNYDIGCGKVLRPY
jgi:hypothetical protein